VTTSAAVIVAASEVTVASWLQVSAALAMPQMPREPIQTAPRAQPARCTREDVGAFLVIFISISLSISFVATPPAVRIRRGPYNELQGNDRPGASGWHSVDRKAGYFRGTAVPPRGLDFGPLG